MTNLLLVISIFFCLEWAGGAQLTGNDWERLRTAEKDWVARQRDCGTTRPRDSETTGPRDSETTRQRDDGTTRRLKNTGVLRRSQAFSAVRGSARRLASEWCRCGASQKRVPRDSTKAYSPWYSTFWDVPQMRRYHAKRPYHNKLLYDVERNLHHISKRCLTLLCRASSTVY